MDGQRFDELTRALAKGTNRRGAIKVLAGGLAGALLGIGGGRSGAAKPDKCPPSKVCGTACCPDGYYCVNGACTTDVPAVVPEDTGKGGAGCAAGQKRCASQCVDLANDVNNCGTCGNNCATVANATTICNGGVCDYVCNAPFDDCNGSAADGCETNLTNDVNHCGACTYSCEANKPANTVVGGCVNGGCEYVCAAGFANCNSNSIDCETPLGTVDNCSGCGDACGRNASCVNGTCVCNLGYTDCDGDGDCECPTGVSINNATAACQEDEENPEGPDVCYVTCNAGYTDYNQDVTDSNGFFNPNTNGCECNLNSNDEDVVLCNCTEQSPTVGIACPEGTTCCSGICKVVEPGTGIICGPLQSARLIR